MMSITNFLFWISFVIKVVGLSSARLAPTVVINVSSVRLVGVAAVVLIAADLLPKAKNSSKSN